MPGTESRKECNAAADAERLLAIVHASWMSQAVCVAAELGLAERLAGGPLRAEALAAACGCHAPSLERLLRALASLGVCRARADGAFALTPMGALLRADAAHSLRAWILWWGRHLAPVWGHLLHSVRTGEAARPLVTGSRGFEQLERDAATAALFDRAMAELTATVAGAVVRACDFSGSRRVVDVGGGQGELIAAVLAAHPVLRGVLLDRPHAIAAARRHLERRGVADRCEFVAGDFFQSVPRGADTYLLKSVVDDWNDERAAAILRNCARAMPRGARLLLVEPLMPARAGASARHRAVARADLTMLVTHGARERTEAEMRGLLARAGLRARRAIPTGTHYSVIEAVTPRLSAARRRRA